MATASPDESLGGWRVSDGSMPGFEKEGRVWTCPAVPRELMKLIALLWE